MPPDAIQDALDSAAQWEWVELTTASSNTINDVEAPKTKAVFDKDGAGGTTYTDDADVVDVVSPAMPIILSAWGGIAVGTGDYKQYVWVMGGGHADGGDNSLFQIDLSAANPQWERLTDPNPHGTTQSPDYPAQGAAIFFTYPTVLSDLQPAGQIGPPAAHTYGNFFFDPARECLWYSSTAQYQGSGWTTALWQFDLVAGTWSHFEPSAAVPNSFDGKMFLIPGDTDNIYAKQAGSAIYRYHVVNDIRTRGTRHWSGPALEELDGAFIPSWDETPGVWDYIGANNLGAPSVYPSFNSGADNHSYAASFTGDTPAMTNAAWVRRDVDDKVYSFGNTLGQVQVLTTVGETKGAIAVADLTTTGVTPALTTGSTGNANRVQYMPDYDAFVFVSGDDPSVYLLKAAAGGGSVSLSPAAGEASADGGTPGADAGANLSPGSGAAAADGAAPGMDAGVSLSPGSGEASADGGTPGLQTGGSVSLTPGGGDASADGGAPAADAGVSPAPGAGDASGDGGAAGFAGGHTLVPGAGDAAADGGVPSLGDPATAPGRMTLHETPVAWMTLHETPAAAT